MSHKLVLMHRKSRKFIVQNMKMMTRNITPSHLCLQIYRQLFKFPSCRKIFRVKMIIRRHHSLIEQAFKFQLKRVGKCRSKERKIENARKLKWDGWKFDELFWNNNFILSEPLLSSRIFGDHLENKLKKFGQLFNYQT